VGLFGGTFNPVHYGHLRVAEEIAEGLRLDEVVFMPAADPPHKSPRGLALLSDRVKMLEMSLEGRPRFTVSDLEGRLAGPSYTVNTMRALKAERPLLGAPLLFLVGFDSFKQVGLWHEHQELFRLASFVVFLRPGARGGQAAIGQVLAEATGGGWKWRESEQGFFHKRYLPVIHFRQDSMLRISSTALRSRLREGRSVRYLVPDSVRDFINDQGLYLER
jgi:nicotinate-nucleotide adenylyltransferase